MKFIYGAFFVLTYLNSSNAQFPFFGGNSSKNGGVFKGLKNMVSGGFSGGAQGLQSGLSKGLVGGVTGLATGTASGSLKGLTNGAFGDRKNSNGLPAKVAHTLTDGLTAGLEGLNNNLDKGVIPALSAFRQETNKGLVKGATTGAYTQFKQMLKEIMAAGFEEFKEKAPQMIKKYKTVIYAALSAAAIQASAKLLRSVSEAKQPPLNRVYDKIMTNFKLFNH